MDKIIRFPVREFNADEPEAYVPLVKYLKGADITELKFARVMIDYVYWQNDENSNFWYKCGRTRNIVIISPEGVLIDGLIDFIERRDM